MKQSSKSISGLHIAVIIPTYNEAQNIKKLIRSIVASTKHHSDLVFHLCIIDDSSPDGTAKVALDELKRCRTGRIHGTVLSQPRKSGLGKAYVYGFRHVLKNLPQAQYVLQMDADLSHDPLYMPAFIELAESGKLDMVIGSRYIRGGSTPDWSWPRTLLSKVANIYARLVLGKYITDYTGGYNLYSRKVLGRLDVTSISSEGYTFQIEMKYRACRLTQKIAELPIIFKDRSAGISKIPRDTVIKTVFLVPGLRFKL